MPARQLRAPQVRTRIYTHCTQKRTHVHARCGAIRGTTEQEAWVAYRSTVFLGYLSLFCPLSPRSLSLFSLYAHLHLVARRWRRVCRRVYGQFDQRWRRVAHAPHAPAPHVRPGQHKMELASARKLQGNRFLRGGLSRIAAVKYQVRAREPVVPRSPFLPSSLHPSINPSSSTPLPLYRPPSLLRPYIPLSSPLSLLPVASCLPLHDSLSFLNRAYACARLHSRTCPLSLSLALHTYAPGCAGADSV